MNLEQYRKKVQRRLTVLRILAAVFIVTMIVVPKLAGDTNFSAFVSGGSVGGALMTILVLTQQSRSLKNDEMLRKLYIAEHDERQQAIRVKSGQPMVLYLSLGMVMAALIAYFFNMVVAATLALAAVAQLLVSMCVKLWYMRTM